MELNGDSGQLMVIERVSSGEPGTPGDEDLLLSVTVKVGGYSARDQAWILVNAWRGFLSELQELERHRHGRATLNGASPHDLRLVFRTTDLVGHMAVSGYLGWHAPDGFAQKLEFGFRFDAGMLQTVG